MYNRLIRTSVVSALAIGAMGLLLTGCGGDQIRGEGRHTDRPKWIDMGGAARSDKAFYGVGVASNVTSISLRRNTADAQARTELAKVFTTRIKNLLKNYEASTNDGEKESAEAHREEATKAFTEMELTGTEIVDRFFDIDQNAQYSLARLDPDAFEAQLERMAKLSARAKTIIRANAQRAFAELDAESERNNAE